MNETKEPKVTLVEIDDAAFYLAAGFSPKVAEELALLRRQDPEAADLLAEFGDTADPDYKHPKK